LYLARLSVNSQQFEWTSPFATLPAAYTLTGVNKPLNSMLLRNGLNCGIHEATMLKH
jgi:hypothetical protein